MIYDFPSPDAPIRQGDIFIRVPRVDFSLLRLPVVGPGSRIREMTWEEAGSGGNPVAAIVAARPVVAIVASQDCDALRAPDITLCEIREFRNVERKGKDTSSPKSWMRIITQHARINQKWFYLPPDPTIGFEVKMAVDFMVTLCVPRAELEELRHLRAGRLNECAEAHFRERIAEFFGRYPHDEWYALDSDEMKAYRRDHPEAERYPWQQSDSEQES